MRYRFIQISSILIASFLFACGNDGTASLEKVLASNDMEQLTAMRAEINAAKEEVLAHLEQLDAAIAKLDTAKNLPLVTIKTLEKRHFDHYVEVQGDVKTDQNIMVFPEFAGILKKVHVKMGDKVSQGQLLATIDDGGLREQLQAAEYQAELAQTTFDRQERLWNQKIGSEIQYLNAKTNAQSSHKVVEQLKQQLEKAAVKAPFAGIIDDVMADEGQLLAPGQTPILRIVNLGKMYVSSNVPESYLASITKGKRVNVFFPVLDTTIKAKISEVSNYINPDNRTYKIEIDLPSASGIVKPNLMARVQINDYHNDEAILVPQSLISENSEGSQYLYKAELNSDSKTAIARKVIIKTGLKQGDMIEIVKGLKVSDVVIKEGARTVKDNQEVEIIN